MHALQPGPLAAEAGSPFGCMRPKKMARTNLKHVGLGPGERRIGSFRRARRSRAQARTRAYTRETPRPFGNTRHNSPHRSLSPLAPVAPSLTSHLSPSAVPSSPAIAELGSPHRGWRRKRKVGRLLLLDRTFASRHRRQRCIDSSSRRRQWR